MAQLSLMKSLSAYPTCRLCWLWEEREVAESDNLVVISAKPGCGSRVAQPGQS